MIELASQPKPKQLGDLLALIVHCVAGYLSPTGGPNVASGTVWGTAATPMADYGETAEILVLCESAAEPAVKLCLRLLEHDAVRVRQESAKLLGALHRFSEPYEVVARVRDRLAREKDPSVRAMVAFALTHLVRDAGPLQEMLGDDDELVRVMAAMGLARRGVASKEVGSLLVGWLTDEALSKRYTSLPFRSDSLGGDIGSLLGSLDPDVLRGAVPALTERLTKTTDFGAVGLLHAALAAVFGEEAPASGSELSPAQRELLETLALNQAFWSIGNALSVLMDRGLPSSRDEMAEFLGITVRQDPLLAARLAARSLGEIDVGRATKAWLKIVRDYPNDGESLVSAGVILGAQERDDEATPLLERALAAGLEGELLGQALFARGLIYVREERPEEAYDAFERAEPTLDPDSQLVARQNRIAMLQELGRAEEALALELEREPVSAEDFYNRGLAQVKAGKYGECIESIGRALEMAPDEANSHYTLACAHALSGNRKEALASIARAIEIDPDLAGDIAEDSDFESLAKDRKFRALVGA